MAVRITSRKRFELTGYSASQMLDAGTFLRDTVMQRILQAQDLGDSPASPLKQPKGRVVEIGGKRGFMRGYPFQKTKKGKKPVRDWNYTGAMLAAMQVMTHRRNRAVIGFSDDLSNMKARINNMRWRQFGVSPKDRSALVAFMATLGTPIKVKAA